MIGTCPQDAQTLSQLEYTSLETPLPQIAEVNLYINICQPAQTEDKEDQVYEDEESYYVKEKLKEDKVQEENISKEHNSKDHVNRGGGARHNFPMYCRLTTKRCKYDIYSVEKCFYFDKFILKTPLYRAIENHRFFTKYGGVFDMAQFACWEISIHLGALNKGIILTIQRYFIEGSIKTCINCWEGS